MHKRTITRALLALMAGLALPATLTQAASSTRPRARTRRPPVDQGPAETRAERDKRLLRECQGRLNAGACEGYAR